MVRAPDLKSGDPEFDSRPDPQLDLFNPSAALVDSQLVCLLPVGILNLLSLFEWIISLALKNPYGERSIKYTYKHHCFLTSSLLKLSENVGWQRETSSVYTSLLRIFLRSVQPNCFCQTEKIPCNANVLAS